MDQILIGAKFSRNPDGLGRASRMAVYDYDFRFCHGEFLSSERLVRSTICRVRPAEICHLIQAHEPDVLIGHPIRTSSPSTLRMQSHTERGCDHQHTTAPRSRGAEPSPVNSATATPRVAITLPLLPCSGFILGSPGRVSRKREFSWIRLETLGIPEIIGDEKSP